MLERDLTKNTLDEERYLGQGLGQGPGDSIERLSRGSTDGRNPGDSASLGIGYGLGQDLTSSQDHGLGLNDFRSKENQPLLLYPQNPFMDPSVSVVSSNSSGSSPFYGNSHASNLNLLEHSDQSPRFAAYDQYGSEIDEDRLKLGDRYHDGYNHRESQSPHDSDGSTASVTSPNPFLSTADLLPFGGYPASSFPLHFEEKEPDDYLHNPDPAADADYDRNRFLYDMKNMDSRSFGGLFGVVVFFIGALVVFIVLPIVTYSGITDKYHPQTYENLSRYKYPLLSAIRTDLVDPDTPGLVLTKKSRDGNTMNLVFSDEFNAEGRTFYEGDDQFFTAPDLHYDATKDLEWYDPDAVTTANGTLNLRMDAYKNHDLFYRSGMVQSWNKMCFTEGRLEISARLPNYGNITGLWPGLWTMGNLGRPGYLGSTDGVWPYSYDSCDAGITANQSSPDGISYLPGQRLNSCTCPGESHPNRGTGRGAPEIDALEAEISSDGLGLASQSLQVAPFDIWYYPDYNFLEIHNHSVTSVNTYTGGPFQQAVSGVTTLNHSWYELGEGLPHVYQKYGFELMNDDDTGYLQWHVGDDPTFTINAKALHPNGNVGWRRLAKEPLSIIMNLGISNSWAYIDWPSLVFPVFMRIDYVRIYQSPNSGSIGCDPEDYPTSDYIESHLNLYENANITSFQDGGYKYPRNSLLHQC
jgi:beta-glucan synthesis-associated protein KRE6